MERAELEKQVSVLLGRIKTAKKFYDEYDSLYIQADAITGDILQLDKKIAYLSQFFTL